MDRTIGFVSGGVFVFVVGAVVGRSFPRDPAIPAGEPEFQGWIAKIQAEIVGLCLVGGVIGLSVAVYAFNRRTVVTWPPSSSNRPDTFPGTPLGWCALVFGYVALGCVGLLLSWTIRRWRSRDGS